MYSHALVFEFQFLEGAIKGIYTEPQKVGLSYFNSSKVRLKAAERGNTVPAS